MPRIAREKSEESMYHVMSRSISEIELFRCDEDKSYYLKLLKRYIDKYHCVIYAFCLMTNHVHLYINPQGYDISSFMQALNTAYVIYYNKRYKRHGHLFQGRFASKVVDNDTYSLTLSAYIHNNACDIPEHKDKEELYKYSSYGYYTGIRKDRAGLCNTDFLLRIFGSDIKKAQEKYRIFVNAMRDTSVIKQKDNNIMDAYTANEYRSEKHFILRHNAPYILIENISRILEIKPIWGLKTKYSRETSKFRAFTAYVMRSICGYSYKKICEYVGNMSLSGITRLVNEGFKLLKEETYYRNVFSFLIQSL